MEKVALLTGAASGIGAAIWTRLLDDGWSVFPVDRDPSVAATGHVADLTRREDNAAAVAAAIERFGRLDAVIASAGYQHVAPIEDLDEKVWESMLALLLTSPFLLAKYGWPHLRCSGAGRFIAIGSVHGHVASAFKAPYVAAKHGLLGLVKELAVEGAEAGISTAAICPAYVGTPLVDSQIDAQARAHAISREDVLEHVLLRRQAVKKLIHPGDVAAAVAFLLSEAGATLTGSSLDMDQGWTAG